MSFEEVTVTVPNRPSAEAPADHVVFAARTRFTQTPDWILFHSGISDAALRTWLVLASYVNKTRTAFPGVATLARDRNKSQRQLFEHLDILEREGLLLREPRYRDDGGRSSTLYTLAWDHPLNCAPAAENRRGVPAENLTPARAQNRTGLRAENLTPRSTPRKEPDPLTPDDNHHGAPRTTSTQGADTPRTPRRNQPNPRPRDRGTNPRAIVRAEQRVDVITTWARRMMGVDGMTLDDFDELVDNERLQGRLTDELADLARRTAGAVASGGPTGPTQTSPHRFS